MAAALALLAFAGLAAFAGPVLLPGLRPLIGWRFPQVRWVAADALAREPAPMLVDARSEAEYGVSHIAGARLLEPGVLPALPQDAAIVVYCSVGYRSAEAAERLQRAGFTNTRNLEGGVFAWANAGRPLFDASGPTDRVHPYGGAWRFLLAARYRAP